MAKKPNEKGVSPELVQAEARIEATKVAIAQALIQRNTLPKSATDEEKAAVAARVEQLQAQHHEAMQHLLAIRRRETTKLEREHKEKKLRHKQLRASRQPGGQAAPHEKPAAPSRRSSMRLPMDRDVEAALMDAANEEDLFLLRQQLEEKDNEGADELAHERDLAEKKRKQEEAARREAEQRERKKTESKAEAARLKAEKEAAANIRQQDALQRAEEKKANKRKQRAERESQQRAVQNASSSAWFSKVLRKLKAFLARRR